MIINMLMPIIGTCIAFAVPFIKQRIDNKNTGQRYVTRSTTLSWYKFFNAGGEYMIHFKYSDAMNVVFVSLMYGLTMPMLFPIAAMTLKLQQIAEMIGVAWVARLPPAMDNALNNNAIKMLRIAPVFLLVNGFWMVDNKAIFDNVWTYRMLATDSMKSNHLFEGFKVTHSTPILMFVIFAAGLKVILALVDEDTIKMWGFTLSRQEMEVIEDLPNFFEAIKLKHAHLIISEYHNIKDRFGFEIEDAEVI